MREVIYDFGELRESKLLYEAEIPRYGLFITYILLALMIGLVLWSIVGKIDINVKVQGIVRPWEDEAKVISYVGGKVKEVFVKEGEYVKKGEVLFKIDDEEYVKKRDLLRQQLGEYEKKIDDLKELRNSIENGESLRNKNNAYYLRYLSYSYEVNKLRKAAEEARVQREYSIMDFKKQMESLDEKIKNIDKFESTLKEIKEVVSKGEQVKLTKYDIGYLGFILSEIEAYNQQVKTKSDGSDIQREILVSKIDSKLDELRQSKSELVLQKQKIEGQLRLLVISGDDTKGDIEKYKLEVLQQIDSEISSLTHEIKNLKINLEETEKLIESCSVRADKDGYVEYSVELVSGAAINSGVEIGRIVGSQARGFKVIGYIPNTKGSSIKIGQRAKVKIAGADGLKVVEGKVARVSQDIKVADQSGQGFYEVEVEVKNVPKDTKLRAGQACEMSIVVEQKRLIEWVLKKLGLRL
ncbi:HlyD family efflux transporter periplasmic adaptor subunit [Caldicellulosiruptor changbaiensis]|uniref:HlyD family efflux transporter periplasmic adaptor subunit n=1 Tax=Caldicellulosiruptor changbaiensis TaxID=1222016 RepID=A0A3T0D5M5_9FIRM|nr:HlyD family efflux transporter periplasmic adaptor subunit [Caldicellulosiruptor changbaiensis]AZT90308.1 HlyD family efflux transporter periplasmic adaptor subunit [Caldicellulosiruptor changbaiensis]